MRVQRKKKRNKLIKLALSDMDNTLVPLGARGASPRTLEAIHAAMDAGVLFGPSTGRDTVELMRLFRADESCFQTGVLSNGKRVRARGKTVSLTLIPHDGLVAIARALADTTMFLVCYPAESNLLNPAYAVGAPSEEVLNRYEARVKFVGGMVDEVPDVDFVAATIACPDGPEQLDATGIGIDEVVVFGDAENDLEILREVPYSVAVANATPEVAATANYHIGACADEGVADALFDIARAAKTGQMPAFLQR